MALHLLLLLKLFFFIPADAGTVPASIYDVKVAAVKGGAIDFAAYKGKKILIVNTPIEADNARQYHELELLSQRYKDKLVIVAFLADDFLTPPGSMKKNTSREKHYDVTFPMAAKVAVKGEQIAPIYKWLAEKKYNGYMDTEVKWDFHKYLINEEGQLVAVFDPNVQPYAAQLIAAIEKQ